MASDTGLAPLFLGFPATCSRSTFFPTGICQLQSCLATGISPFPCALFLTMHVYLLSRSLQFQKKDCVVSDQCHFMLTSLLSLPQNPITVPSIIVSVFNLSLLLSQNTIDWVAHIQQKFDAYSSGGCKSEMRVPARSDEALLQATDLSSRGARGRELWGEAALYNGTNTIHEGSTDHLPNAPLLTWIWGDIFKPWQCLLDT